MHRLYRRVPLRKFVSRFCFAQDDLDIRHPTFEQRRSLLALSALAPILLLTDGLFSSVVGADSTKLGNAADELHQLETKVRNLGVTPEARGLVEIPVQNADAFRNLKERALRLIDDLQTLREERAQSTLDDTADFLRRITEAERSVPSPEARAAALKPAFDEKIRADYRNLFDSCTIRPKYKSAVQQDLDRMLRNRSRYEQTQNESNVPWYVIGVVHNLEASFNFAGHLHNGDDIRFKTRNVPRGRPVLWDPPKTSKDWEISAKDALTYDSFAGQNDWSLEQSLYRLEGYNGWGPRQVHKSNTPYLWSFSTNYDMGKYDSDGHWSPTLVSDQCGAGVLIKALVDAGSIPRPSNSHS